MLFNYVFLTINNIKALNRILYNSPTKVVYISFAYWGNCFNVNNSCCFSIQ